MADINSTGCGWWTHSSVVLTFFASPQFGYIENSACQLCNTQTKSRKIPSGIRPGMQTTDTVTFVGGDQACFCYRNVVDVVGDLVLPLPDLPHFFLEVGLLAGDLLPGGALGVEVRLVDLYQSRVSPVFISVVSKNRRKWVPQKLTPLVTLHDSLTSTCAFKMGMASTSTSICRTLSSIMRFRTLSCRSCSSTCINVVARESIWAWSL